MTGLLHEVHVYRQLVLRTKQSNIPLDAGEQDQLATLAKSLGMGEGQGTRQTPRFPCMARVVVALPNRMVDGRLHDIAAGGMRVRIDVPPRLGTPLLVYAPGDPCGGELTFPARVVWTRLGEMGLQFDGAPSIDDPGEGRRRRRRSSPPLVA